MNDWAVLPVLAANVERPAISPEVSDYLRASLSDNSRRAYRSDLNHFLAFLKSCNHREATDCDRNTR